MQGGVFPDPKSKKSSPDDRYPTPGVAACVVLTSQTSHVNELSAVATRGTNARQQPDLGPDQGPWASPQAHLVPEAHGRGDFPSGEIWLPASAAAGAERSGRPGPIKDWADEHYPRVNMGPPSL